MYKKPFSWGHQNIFSERKTLLWKKPWNKSQIILYKTGSQIVSPIIINDIYYNSFLFYTGRCSFQRNTGIVVLLWKLFLAYHLSYNSRFGILWSLAIEEHFYFLFPVILVICLRRPKFLFGTVIILTIIPLVLRILVASHYDANNISSSYTYSLTHCRFDSILYGCLMSILLKSKYSDKFLKIISAKPVYVTAFL